MSDKIIKAPTGAIDPIDSLVQRAVEAGSVDVLERLLAVRQQVHADQARSAFYASLIGFQNACPVIGKTVTATIKPGFSYKYTPLEEIAHTIRALLNDQQLGYRWFTSQEANKLTVTCRISHALGHIEETSLTVPVGSDPQRPAWPVAQSLTYAKRYTLCNALGIVVGGEDDDAQEPVASAPQTETAPASPKPSARQTLAPPTPRTGRTVTVATIKAVTTKTGETNGKAWTRHSIIAEDGQIYSTFDDDIARDAKELEGCPAELTWEQSGRYLNCTAIAAIGGHASNLDEETPF